MEQIKTAKSKSKGLSSNALKLIAIAAMTSDNFLYLFIIVFVKILTSF